jgi:hypothetical protein
VVEWYSTEEEGTIGLPSPTDSQEGGCGAIWTVRSVHHLTRGWKQPVKNSFLPEVKGRKENGLIIFMVIKKGQQGASEG